MFNLHMDTCYNIIMQVYNTITSTIMHLIVSCACSFKLNQNFKCNCLYFMDGQKSFENLYANKNY